MEKLRRSPTPTTQLQLQQPKPSKRPARNTRPLNKGVARSTKTKRTNRSSGKERQPKNQGVIYGADKPAFQDPVPRGENEESETEEDSSNEDTSSSDETTKSQPAQKKQKLTARATKPAKRISFLGGDATRKKDPERKDKSFQHWLEICAEPNKKPRIQSLITALKLETDDSLVRDRGLDYPLRRLVISGYDITPNMRALFGVPYSDPRDRLQRLWVKHRIEVIRKPKKRSEWDSEWEGWKPRKVTAEERVIMKRELKKEEDRVKNTKAQLKAAKINDKVRRKADVAMDARDKMEMELESTYGPIGLKIAKQDQLLMERTEATIKARIKTKLHEGGAGRLKNRG